MERYLTWGTTQNLRKTWKSGMRRTGKKMTTSTMNEIESILRRKHWPELLRKSTTKRISLLWTYGKTSENLRWNFATSKCVNSWEERRNAKLHFRRKKMKNYLRFETREEKILELHQQNLDELLKNELNHEEPPWRTPSTRRWWNKMKDERIRWALRWFIWRFQRNGQGKFELRKRKDETLETRIYSSRTNSEERDYSLDEIRMRFIVCLSFIKLNWWQAMDFSYYLFSLKKD